MGKYKKRYGSLTGELAVIIVGLVAGTVALCWFINNTFLEKYYMLHKQETLRDGFEVIDAASESGELTDDDFDVTFENLCANGNITAIITSADERKTVRASANANELILMEFMNVMSSQPGDGQSWTETLQLTEDYVIQKQTDTRLSSEYLVLYGTLSDGSYVLMRTAFESIRESAKISNRFLMYVGVAAVIISAVAAFFVSKGITMPILELTDISKRMTELDFEAEYHGRKHGANEIDELGDHFNRLSRTLETTISELKSVNNELKQDIAKKTEIDEMRRDFLSNVSHELKTPLALIQGYAEGLRECINDDAESRDFYCEVIMDEAGKMNQMVKKLLTLNQLEFGAEIVQMEHFNLTELIQGVTDSIAILLRQEKITLEWDEGEPLYAWGDEFKVEEVVTNYLSNAIHHADFDRRIRIWYTKKEDCVRVSVFNTGKPIPEEDVDNIWIKFYKVDKARTREYGGSGIGLSIVKAIMESFHRECGVINHADGVEFWFELDTEKTGLPQKSRTA